jgi:hypothetical protein
MRVSRPWLIAAASAALAIVLGGCNSSGQVRGHVSWWLYEVSPDERSLAAAHEANLCVDRVGPPVVSENARTVTITLPRIAGKLEDGERCTLESRTEITRIRLAAPLGSRTLQQPDDAGGVRVVAVPRWRGNQGTSTTACLDSAGAVRCAPPLAYEWCRTERPPVSSRQLSHTCLELAVRYGAPAPAPATPLKVRPTRERRPVDLSKLLERRIATVLPTGWQVRLDAGRSTSKRLGPGYLYGFNLATPLRETTPQRSFDLACAAAYRQATRILKRRGQRAELHCRLDRLSLLGR